MVKFDAASRMFTAIEEQQIHVVCPSGLVTGGTELLHQLVGRLVHVGRDASIAYTPWGREWATPDAFKRYGCPVRHAVPDESGVTVIVPEVSTEHLTRFRRARHVVWWLSVDNYRGGFGGMHQLVHYVRRHLHPNVPAGATHLFQSAYAREFVGRRFGRNGAMLTDFIADEYVAGDPPLTSRRNVVAFNPKKGWPHTSRLIKMLPGVDFIALEGMDRAQLKATLDTCKVYIDFGEHPGKDRLPREAAARGTVVIVGRRGSANYPEDMPLPEPYKIDCSTQGFVAACELIRDALDHFEWHHGQQLPYRIAIGRERETFERQIDHVFAIKRMGLAK